VRRAPGELGQGLIPTVAGFTVVLILVLFATQVAFDLYARTAVTAAALDAARSVASSSGPTTGDAALQSAETRARGALGAYGVATSFRWDLLPSPAGPQEVHLTVSFDLTRSRYSLVGPLTLPGLSHFSRTVRVRIERVTCPHGATCAVVAPAGGAQP